MQPAVCIICNGTTLTKFIDFGRVPNVNRFPSEHTKNKEQSLPIAMLVCRTCWCVQLEHFSSPEYLFSGQPYVTGLNVPTVQYFKKLVPHVIKKLSLKPSDLVLDIGCNDGTLLEIFKNHGMKIMGVDPSRKTYARAAAKEIPVMKRFWNKQLGSRLHARGISPALITATAVFYHVPDLHDFVRGIREVMHRETVFMVQCLYLKDVIDKNQVENIYHEHRAIHAIAPLVRLFSMHMMRVLDVEFSTLHGGSFIMYVGRADHPMPTSARLWAALLRERQAQLYSLETYKKFAVRVNRNIRSLRALLQDLKAKGKTVYALGAPAKGNMLLYIARIRRQHIPYAVEVNAFKVGRVTPGTHIPIVSEHEIGRPPDYYFILSWNYLEYFMKKYRSFLTNGGRFIVADPHPHIV